MLLTCVGVGPPFFLPRNWAAMNNILVHVNVRKYMRIDINVLVVMRLNALNCRWLGRQTGRMRYVRLHKFTLN